MNQLLDTKRAKRIGWSLAFCFLAIHIVMVVMFAVCGVTPMFYFNLFSILFYAVSIYLIYREFFFFFVVSTYLEVVLHMFLAVLFTGWGNGFQITLIGMSVMAFFAEYMGRTMQVRHIRALPLCILGMCAYLLSFVITSRTGVLYPLPEKLSYWLQISWGVIVFAINAAALLFFTLLTFHSEELLNRQATTDVLTGLPNRYFVTRSGMDFMHRTGWVAMLDIDDFKVINDTHGHNFGDYVLRTLAELMRAGLEDATACRWGGEEFLLLGTSDDPDALGKQLDAFRVEISEHPFTFDEVTVFLTITIGLAVYQPGTELMDWINTADKKLYLGKRSGKNQVVV